MANVALLSPQGFEASRRLISAKLGTQLGADEFPQAINTRVLKGEREFNRKAGFTNHDDRLPSFHYEEALPPHHTVFVIGDEEIDSTIDFRRESRYRALSRGGLRMLSPTCLRECPVENREARMKVRVKPYGTLSQRLPG